MKPWSEYSHSWTQRFTRGTISVLLLRSFGIGLAFGLNVLLARLLGLAHYGQYVYLVVLAGFVAVLGPFGFDASVMLFLPEYRVAGKRYLATRLIWTATLIVMTVASGCAVLLVAGLSLDPLNTIALTTDGWIALLVPLTALSTLNQGVLQGLGWPARALVSEYLVRPVCIAIAVWFLWFENGRRLSVEMALVGTVIGLAAGIVLQYLLIHSANRGVSGDTKPVTYPWKLWLAVAWPLLGMGFLNMTLARSDLLLLGIFRNPDVEGYYQPAVRLAGFISFGLAAINGIVAPMISELYAQKRMTELQALVNRTVRSGSILGCLVAIILAIDSRLLLRLFGPGFDAGRWPLLILMIGQLVNVSVGPVGYFLAMTNSHRAAFWILLQGALLGVLAAWFAIPFYGAMGAALASSLAMIWWNIAMVVFLRHRYGWWIIPFFGIRTRAATP